MKGSLVDPRDRCTYRMLFGLFVVVNSNREKWVWQFLGTGKGGGKGGRGEGVEDVWGETGAM